MNSGAYLQLLGKWAPFALKDIYRIPGRSDLICYGTGDNNWGVQTNQKALAAFAILATDPALDAKLCSLSKESLLETSLSLLRFSLESHIEGSYRCLDVSKWGHTWISALGIERMMHAVDALKPALSPDDIHLLRRVLISEADWLMDNYEIVGDPDASTGKNKPESNLWNGALLHRVAAMYPDAKRTVAYKEKGSKFLVNSISIPSDANSAAMVDGKMVKERFAGANFFESLSLDHHSYLNVGYMAICVSNAAMLHFFFKHAGIKPPESLYHHLEALCNHVKNLTFPDGRLLRIGGDTRVRYCYCQDYMIPAWLLAVDWLNDADAPVFEREWLKMVEDEQESNGDGSFLSDRCRILRNKSALYYTRLEADRACTISMGAYWRRLFTISTSNMEKPASASTTFAWSEPFHGAVVQRDSKRVASWVWRAAEHPCGVFVPAQSSDMAEWHHNLAGETTGSGRLNWNETTAHIEKVFPGGFITCGSFVSRSDGFIAEGKYPGALILHHVAFAALPDSRTGIVFQRARALMRCRLTTVKGLNLLVPNDVFNGFKRTIRLQDGTSKSLAWKSPGKDRIWNTGSRSVVVDGKLGVAIIYGSDSIAIHTPPDRQIGLKGKPEGGGMLNALEICSSYAEGSLDVDEGATLFDAGCALFAGDNLPRHLKMEMSTLDCGKALDFRAALVEGADGLHYLFAANFGGHPATVDLNLPKPFSAAKSFCGGAFEHDGGRKISICIAPCEAIVLVLRK